MANEGDIQLIITLEDGQVTKALGTIEKKSQKTADNVEEDFSEGFKRAAKGFAVAAAAAFAAVTAAAAVVGKRSVEAASRQQDAINQLNQALVASGTFTEQASQSLQDYAAQIERTTTLGDELVLEQLALARTFARSNEEARDLVDAAIELSAATGTELRSAVVNLGKSFSGLTGELGESVAEIRTLTAEELKNGAAIDLIKSKYDGFAAAQTRTFSGSLAQLSNSFGSLQEAIGRLIIQSPLIVDAFTFIKDQVDALTETVGAVNPGTFLKDLLIDGLAVARFFGSILFPLFNVGINFINRFTAQLGLLAGTFQQLLSGQFRAAAETTKELFRETFDFKQLFDTSGSDSALAFIDGFTARIDEQSEVVNQKMRDTGKVAGTNLAVGFQEGFEFINPDGQDTGIFTSFVNSFKLTTEIVKQQSIALINTLRGTFVTGLNNAFASIGSALVNGENAFAAFGKAVLGLFGDLALQLSQFYFLLGIGNLFLNPGAAAGQLAAAAGLAILGGALKSLAGGGGATATAAGAGTGSATAGTPGVGVDSGIVSAGADETTTGGAQVNLTIQGNVLDRRETGLEIAEILRESFDSNATVFTV